MGLYSSEELLQFYEDFIHPCMAYCSHVWGSRFHLSLKRIKSKVKKPINRPNFIISLTPYPWGKLVPWLFYIGNIRVNLLHSTTTASPLQLKRCPICKWFFVLILETPNLLIVVPPTSQQHIHCRTPCY